MSVVDDVINSVIKIITSIADLDESTKDLLVIRKFEDAVRPTKSYAGESCGQNKLDVYGEISLDEIEEIERCRGTFIDDLGRTQSFSTNIYEAKVDIDFVDCGAFSFAADFLCHISLPEIKDAYLPEGIKIMRTTNIVNITALEGGAVSRERVTFSIYLRYSCSTMSEVPQVIIDLETNECGKLISPIVELIN